MIALAAVQQVGEAVAVGDGVPLASRLGKPDDGTTPWTMASRAD